MVASPFSPARARPPGLMPQPSRMIRTTGFAMRTIRGDGGAGVEIMCGVAAIGFLIVLLLVLVIGTGERTDHEYEQEHDHESVPFASARNSFTHSGCSRRTVSHAGSTRLGRAAGLVITAANA